MAEMTKELQFSSSNKVGKLADIAEALQKGGVNIMHIWACGEGPNACFGVVTNKNAKAKEILKKMKIQVKEKGVIVSKMQNKIGSLAKAARKLANAHINITALAATTSGDRASVLMMTNKNDKAKKLV
jgi:hypothetical protein